MKNVNDKSLEARSSAATNPSDKVNAYVLVAAAAQTVTVPAESYIASFSATAPFYVNFNGGTAATPTINITDGTSSVLNPTTRYVTPASTFSIIAPTAAIVTISYYAQG